MPARVCNVHGHVEADMNAGFRPPSHSTLCSETEFLAKHGTH